MPLVKSSAVQLMKNTGRYSHYLVIEASARFSGRWVRTHSGYKSGAIAGTTSPDTFTHDLSRSRGNKNRGLLRCSPLGEILHAGLACRCRADWNADFCGDGDGRCNRKPSYERRQMGRTPRAPWSGVLWNRLAEAWSLARQERRAVYLGTCAEHARCARRRT